MDTAVKIFWWNFQFSKSENNLITNFIMVGCLVTHLFNIATAGCVLTKHVNIIVVLARSGNHQTVGSKTS